jgi:hypothetical protein
MKKKEEKMSPKKKEMKGCGKMAMKAKVASKGKGK